MRLSVTRNYFQDVVQNIPEHEYVEFECIKPFNFGEPIEIVEMASVPLRELFSDLLEQGEEDKLLAAWQEVFHPILWGDCEFEMSIPRPTAWELNKIAVSVLTQCDYSTIS